MQRLLLSIGCAIVLAAVPAAVQAQATKTVKGTLTAVEANSITVKGPDGDVTLSVDGKSRIIAPGASTTTEAVKKQGDGAKPALTAFLKTGQNVNVEYHEQGMHAAVVRVVTSVPDPSKPAAPKAQTVHGVVTATSGSSLTVKGDAEWTFVVDAKTTVTGTGVGTATKKLVDEGKKASIPDLVHEGDTVSVTYRDVDGSKQASIVRITQRKS